MKTFLARFKQLSALIIIFIILLNSCKKNNSSTEESITNGQFIPSNKIREWYQHNEVTPFLTVDETKAEQKLAGNQKAVRMPLLNIDKSPLATLTLQDKQTQAIGKKKLSELSNGNTKFNNEHPPELYIIDPGNGQDTLHACLANFIPDSPDKEYGQNGIWTGKLYEWNLRSDTLYVQVLVKSKRVDRYFMVRKPETGSAKSNSNIWDWLGGVLGSLWDAINWVGYYLQIPGSRIRNQEAVGNDDYWLVREWPSWDFGGGGGGGGSTGTGDYGSTYVDYSSALDLYQYWTPYDPTVNISGPNPSGSNTSNNASSLITSLSISDYAKKDFLYNNPAIADELYAYLLNNGSTQENKDFLVWGVEYLMADPSLFNQAFKDLLNGIFNETAPIYLPENFNIIYDQAWYDNEDELAVIGNELQQQGLNHTDPIPEMYYKNGTPIDMRPASPRNGFTVKGAPRNPIYFWKELAKKRPEMFDQANRAALRADRSPIVNEQWIKYNPTHKSYMGETLIHHHEEQSYMAYAIPKKVHVKWSAILHQFRSSGKIPSVRGTLNSLISIMQVFTSIVDIQTSNPDAWINWFGAHNEKGKIYFDPFKNVYWEIIDQAISKNSAGVPVRAVVHYYVYSDQIWDSDEQRHMGVNKLAEFTEDLDLINKTSTDVTKVLM